MDNFYKKSEKLLLALLKEPGAFSFFPSSIFWEKKDFDLENIYKNFFQSENYKNKDIFTKNLLYIHIPFCSKICSYCNCFKYLLRKKEEIDIYIDYLEKEAKIYFALNNFQKIKIDGIFIWWWTPNILDFKQFEKLFFLIDKYFEIWNLDDFIIDWHPNLYNREKLLFLKNNWATRVTFAVQTFDKNVLLKNNRDFYDLEKLKENIFFAREIWLKVNIDILIWLNWQNIDIFKKDMEILKTIQYDNLSVHYFMNSNNIFYNVEKNYLDLVAFSKKYFEENKNNIFYSNVFEDYYASTKNTTITLWTSAVTNIFSKIIYQKPQTKKYYNFLDNWKLPFEKWLLFAEKIEMIKYIYLNILSWINIKNFYNIYKKNIFKEFFYEFSFLNNHKVITIKDWILKTNLNDKETLIYFNIFIMKNFFIWNIIDYDILELENFFINWILIDR